MSGTCALRRGGLRHLFIYSFVDLFICFFISRYQRAAARGDSDAMFSLGVCLFDGIGVAVDEPRALALWEQAAGVWGGGGGGGMAFLDPTYELLIMLMI